MKFVKIVLAICILIPGYFYLYTLLEASNGFSQLQAQFTKDDLFDKCQWNEDTTLLDCYHKPYLSFLADACPFMAQRAFSLQVSLANRDYNYHVTDLGKIKSVIRNLELANDFMLNAKKGMISRRRNMVPGLILSYFNRDKIIGIYHSLYSEGIKTLSAYQDILREHPELLKRYERVYQDYSLNKRTLKTTKKRF